MKRNKKAPSYTRAQAIADGLLIDVTDTARSAGLNVLVAITPALWADILAVPPLHRAHQDVLDRLSAVLLQARWAMIDVADAWGSYEVAMPVGDRETYQVTMLIGPDENGNQCLMLMRPEEK